MEQKLRAFDRWAQSLEEFAIDQLSRLATWLAPAVPAVLVYHAALSHIPDVNEITAGLIAVVIELLGLATINNWLNVREFNRLFPNKQLRTSGSFAMVAFYVATVLAIVFGLKIAPDKFYWLAILSMSVLSLVSGIAFVMRRQHNARLAGKREEIERLREEEEHERTMVRQQRHLQRQIELDRMKAKHQAELEQMRLDAQYEQAERGIELERKRAELERLNRPEPERPNVRPVRSAPNGKDELLERLMAFYAENPYATLSDAGEEIGRAKSTVSEYLSELEAAGRVHRNGNGVEVMG